MISDLKMLHLVSENIPSEAKRLMIRFWPGPLTLVLRAKPSLSLILTAGKKTVAVRFPDHPVPLRLIAAMGSPLAATSANRSEEPSPKTAGEAALQLSGKVPLILDGGSSRYGTESTIVECTGSDPIILRSGALSAQKIKTALQ